MSEEKKAGHIDAAAENAFHLIQQGEMCFEMLRGIQQYVYTQHPTVQDRVVIEAFTTLHMAIHKKQRGALQNLMAFGLLNEKWKETARKVAFEKMFGNSPDGTRKSIAHLLSVDLRTPSKWKVADEEQLRVELEEGSEG